MLDNSASGTPGPRSDTRMIAAIAVVAVLAFQMDLDRRTRSRVPNGVADDVLDCAAEQIRVRLDRAFAVGHQIDTAVAFARFPLRVRDDVRDERLQIGRAAFPAMPPSCRGGQRQEPTDHLVQALGVALEAIEQRVLAEALAGQSRAWR